MTYYQKRGSKYGAKSKVYNGRLYHSKKEAGYAKELDEMVASGEVREWQPQFRVNLEVNGQHITTFIPDFYVIMADGSEEIHEVKGFETEMFRLKRKIFEATYLKENPHIKYLIIK